MGYNYDGELGDGTYDQASIPEKIVPSGVTAIAAGGSHSLFIKSDGSLWPWAATNLASWATAITTGTTSTFRKDCGQRRHGDCRRRLTQFVYQSDGSLWAMGGNGFGELGDGTLNSAGQTAPKRLWPAASRRLPEALITVCFSRATAASGHGDNDPGQLGDGTVHGQPARKDCGQWRHGDCRRLVSQPVSQERWQSLGMGDNQYGELGDARSTTPTKRSRFWALSTGSPASY